jgi:hypothetical protein
MTIIELKKHLKESSQDQLVKDIVDLYYENDLVKDYYIKKHSAGNKFSRLNQIQRNHRK